ncbi:MAG: hypothetical protein V7K26_23755 [Nostoc sp.]
MNLFVMIPSGKCDRTSQRQPDFSRYLTRCATYSWNPSPNLSPKRREALILAPLPLQGRGWGLGF